jgi:flavorubredoxin
MSNPFQAVTISDHVHWVGAIDWAIRDFHGYATNRGSTYNAYLITGSKTILVDTVKAPFKEEMLARIGSVLDPGHIDIIISNHAEMDHSGCLPEVIGTVKPERILSSTLGAKALQEHFHLDGQIEAVKDGQKLSLGDVNLTFLETRMLHWPDSMMTYLAEDGVLFSQDGFGMHLASGERFADEIEDWVLKLEAAKYYANILMPYSQLIIKLLEKVGKLNFDIEMIAPDHGPVWRRKPHSIVDRYAEWAQQKPTRKAVVFYDTMWGSTERMARSIVDGLRAGGATVKNLSLRASHRSDAATEILDAGALLVGSPTINNQIFPTVADALTYLKGLKPQNLIGTAFGSYGWSGESVGLIKEVLEEMKVEPVGADLKVKYVPNASALARCASLGSSVAGKLAELDAQ